MKSVKIKFSQPVRLNMEDVVKEVIVDGDGHNSLERNVQYILCKAMSDMKYRGLKSFIVEVID